MGLTLDDILKLVIDLINIFQNPIIPRLDFFQLPSELHQTWLEGFNLLNHRRLLLLQIVHGSLRLLDIILILSGVDRGRLLRRLSLIPELLQNLFHVLYLAGYFTILTCGIIPRLLMLVRGIFHPLLLLLVPRHLLLQCLHLVLRRLDRRRSINANGLPHPTVIAHHHHVATFRFPVIALGEEEHLTNLPTLYGTPAILPHEKGLFTAFLGISEGQRIDLCVIHQHVERHGIFHAQYARYGLHPGRGGGNVVPLLRRFRTDTIQRTIAGPAPEFPADLVHQLEIVVVGNDEPIQGAGTDGQFGDFGVFFLAVHDLDIQSHGTGYRSLEFVGPRRLLDCLRFDEIETGK